MKTKWLFTVSILMMMGSLGPGVCQAQGIKQTQPIDMQMVKEKKARVSQSPQGAIRLTTKPAEAAAHPFSSVNDSLHPVTHVIVINPSLSQNKGSRHAINQQPLPPKASPAIRSKAARHMINQQPLPPKSNPVINHKISH